MRSNSDMPNSPNLEVLNRGISWYPVGKRTVPPLLAYLTMDAQCSGKFRCGTGLDFSFEAVRKLDHEYALSKYSVRALHGILSRKAREEPKFILRLTDVCRKACESAISCAAEIGLRDLTLLGKEDLLQMFELLYQKLVAVMTFGFVPHVLNRVLEERIVEYLSEVLSPKGELDKINEYFNKLVFLREAPKITEEELQILNLSAEIEADAHLKDAILSGETSKIITELQNKHPRLVQRLEGLKQSYGWLRKSYWVGQMASLQWYVDQIKDNLRKGSQAEITRRIREKQERELEFKKTLETLSPPESLVTLVYSLQALMFLHTFRIEALFWADHLAPNLFQAISRTTQTSVEDLLWYTTPEVRKAITEGATLPNNIVAIRKDSYGIFMFHDHIFLVTGDELKRIMKSETAGVHRIDKFEGRPAFKKGKVRGVVRIIVSKDDIPKMKQGDILVASMTNTYLMPAVTKAGAIVTDEGGVTSHAAIVARELKIPCVIGTQIATKWLQDGDIVEVDSDHGIVTVI